MNPTDRRSFLKISATLAALPLVRLPAAQSTAGATPTLPEPKPGKSRGLIFGQADLARIRANFELPRLAEMRAKLETVDFATETTYLRDKLRLHNHVEDFGRVWAHVEHRSLAYTLWGDQRQLDLALLAMDRLCVYERWDYFLEAGKDTIGMQRAPEATIASCFALDWLGEKVPAALVAKLENKILTEGAPACYRTLYGMKYPDRVRGWGFDPEEDQKFTFDLSRWPIILNSTNLKVIPLCALGLAGIWFEGRNLEAPKWLELARQSAQAFSTMYGLDGAYEEGVAYWGYTTSHMVMFAEALHRRLGIDDRKLVNYPGTMRYALAFSMPCLGEPIADPQLNTPYNFTPKFNYTPSQDVVNFNDASTTMDVSVASWAGEVFNDPLSHHLAQHTGSIKLWQGAIWYQPAAPSKAPGPELHDVHLSNDLVISRTGWKPEDTVVAFRSGGPANHEHADRNSVIFKAYGDRLFHDPFKAGYSPKIPRWLLRQTEAHTAVLIDGEGHQYHDGREGTNASWSLAVVTSYKTGDGWMRVVSDATEAYQLVNPGVQRVERTLLFLKPDVLVIRDRVTLATAQAVQLRFQVFNEDGKADSTVQASAFTIARPFAKTHATVHTAGGRVRCATGQLAMPATEGVFPFVEVTSESATSHEVLTVCTAAPADKSAGALTVTRRGNDWHISGSHLGRTINTTLPA
ncbi:heparinase II/III domain-containing protein [Oleiharenicola lentus]|uniref:heparinase II/III domain-containing protein n=1 Tax=Oleiharenicola lentus TaxID=2508720 RepID=UPI003F664DE1